MDHRRWLLALLAFLGLLLGDAGAFAASRGAARGPDVPQVVGQVVRSLHREGAHATQARKPVEGPDEQADRSSPASSHPGMRHRAPARWDAAAPDPSLAAPATRAGLVVVLAAFAVDVDRTRIAQLLERILRSAAPREPNPARGPPRR